MSTECRCRNQILTRNHPNERCESQHSPDLRRQLCQLIFVEVAFVCLLRLFDGTLDTIGHAFLGMMSLGKAEFGTGAVDSPTEDHPGGIAAADSGWSHHTRGSG